MHETPVRDEWEGVEPHGGPCDGLSNITGRLFNVIELNLAFLIDWLVRD